MVVVVGVFVVVVVVDGGVGVGVVLLLLLLLLVLVLVLVGGVAVVFVVSRLFWLSLLLLFLLFSSNLEISVFLRIATRPTPPELQTCTTAHKQQTHLLLCC